MKINRNNYESFIIDYLDRTLASAERLEVERFLAANPDLIQEMEELKEAIETPHEENIMDKTRLLRNMADLTEITNSNFEEWCIAWLEGDLNNVERDRLTGYIVKHPEKKALFELHQHLFVSPDEKIEFPEKSKLKKLVVRPYRRAIKRVIVSITAASIMALVYFSLRTDLPFRNQQIAADQDEKEMSNKVNSTKNITTAKTHSDQTFSSLRAARAERKKWLSVVDSGNPNPDNQVIIAAVDSSSGPFGTIILAEAKPIEALIEQDLSTEIQLDLPQKTNPEVTAETRKIVKAELQQQENKNPVNRRQNILLTTLTASINGFNALTENDIVVETDENDSGELTMITIEADNFKLSRKLRKPIQN